MANLLQAAENILFSFKVSQEIMQKYETLRKKTFEKCGIPYYPIQLGIKSEGKTEKIPETQNKSVETDEIVEPDTITPYLNVNLSILASMSEKVSRLLSEIFQLTGNTALDTVPVIVKAQATSSALESLKGQLSNQILSIDSSLQTAIHELNYLSEHYSSLKQELVAQKHIFLSHSENLDKTLSLQQIQYKDQIESLNSLLATEKNKLKTQQDSLEHIIELQEKEIELQAQEILDLQEFISQKTHESETIKKVLQDEVLFSNEQRLKMLDEANENYEDNLKKILDEKKILEVKVLELEKMLIEEREYYKETIENKESQFFNHLDNLNMEINEINGRMKALEIENTSLTDEKKQVFLDLSRIFQHFNGFGLKAKEGEEAEAIFGSLEKIKKLVEKLTVENNWLVDRLSYFEANNKSLRNKLNQTTNSEFLKESNSGISDFEKSRVNFKNYLQSNR